MRLQRQLNQFVETHRRSLATVRLDLEKALPEVAEKWSYRFADPNDVSGHSFCPDVREVMLDEGRMRGKSDDMTLLCRRGQGGSVVYYEVGGTEFRVRKFPAKHLTAVREREVSFPPVEQFELAEEIERVETGQLNLFGADSVGPRMPRAQACEEDEEYDGLFALWALGDDGESLEGMLLCAVRGVDNPNRAVIMAAVPFPLSSESPLFHLDTKVPVDHPEDDFDAHTPTEKAGGEDDPGTGPA